MPPPSVFFISLFWWLNPLVPHWGPGQWTPPAPQRASWPLRGARIRPGRVRRALETQQRPSRRGPTNARRLLPSPKFAGGRFNRVPRTHLSVAGVSLTSHARPFPERRDEELNETPAPTVFPETVRVFGLLSRRRGLDNRSLTGSGSLQCRHDNLSVSVFKNTELTSSQRPVVHRLTGPALASGHEVRAQPLMARDQAAQTPSL
ncbi:unnamed protein product [Lota lota]